MEFKEYSEFMNPLEEDYDLKGSDSLNGNSKGNYNPYAIELVEMIGMLEDVSEEELLEEYGITYDEYFNPTSETVQKVVNKFDEKQSVKRM